MKFYPRTALALWLLSLALSGWWVARHITVTTDLTAFFPPIAGRNQQLLADQLRNGVASRLILIGLQGGEPQALADVSRRMARRLRESGLFGHVSNGGSTFSAEERAVLLRYRYLISPRVNPEAFTPTALRQALLTNLELLGSPAGAMVKASLPSDPTGELFEILSGLSTGHGPSSRHGVWFSADGGQALLVAETLAAGFDVDKQQEAVSFIRQAFAAAGPPRMTLLLLSGPGVFAAASRVTIEQDSWRLSAVATGLVILILFSVYRSVRVVLFSMLPVMSGLLVGIAAVGWVFGSVHGITLGFGATLIGEAVDYPTYLFTHVAPGEAVRDTLRRIWPTLRLAVLTTVFGSLTMLLSSFAGLSQLGLLSITGVLAAGLVTRWVLPALATDRFTLHNRQIAPVDWARLLQSFQMGVWLVWVLLAAALVILANRHASLWDEDLANMSPVSEAAKKLDKRLRDELGAPDVRYLLVVRKQSREEALRGCEDATVLLRGLVDGRIITGFETACRYVPSRETQLRRRAALPDSVTLQSALSQAMRGLPFREGLFVPFLSEVEQARTGRLMEVDDLQGSALGLKVRSLLFKSGDEWVALALVQGVTDEARLAASLRPPADSNAVLLDLKAETNLLVNGYRNESLRLTGLGIAAIMLVLAWGLRNPVAVGRVILPVLMAVVMAVAFLLMLGERLSLFHLVSLLLVIGVGLNYALFFNREQSETDERQRTALSLTVCGLTTLSAFGCLAFSQTRVLHAIGLTVSLGVVLSLLVSAALAKREPA